MARAPIQAAGGVVWRVGEGENGGQMEVAIIHRRTAGTGRQNLLTRRAAGVLVGALELAVIIGALTSGALVEATSMSFLLALPAIVVSIVFFVIWFGIEDTTGT